MPRGSCFPLIVPSSLLSPFQWESIMRTKWKERGEDLSTNDLYIHLFVLVLLLTSLQVRKLWFGKARLNNGEGNGTLLQYSCLENPMDGGAWWAAVHGIAKSWTGMGDFTFTFYFHALEKEMATHSIVLAWRIPGTGEPGGLPSMGSHRVGHDWSNIAAADSPKKTNLVHFSHIVINIDWFYCMFSCLLMSLRL